jgi:dipeptidyl aminopeptidase/acylaminoacyl peptidase
LWIAENGWSVKASPIQQNWQSSAGLMGGYAALQSGVVAPSVFEAIVAVAPVTDLGMYKAQFDGRGTQYIGCAFIGTGPEVIEAGSPARNAAKITAPVLMFHGEVDGNVEIAESKAMEAKLRAAGKSVRLVTYPALDHQLPDSAARADMLRQSDSFLRTTLGIK